MEILVYKKKSYKSIFTTEKPLLSIDLIINQISTIAFNSLNPNQNCTNDYISLYNQLIYWDDKTYEDIIIKSSQIIKGLFDQMLSKILNISSDAKLSSLFQELSKIDLITKNIKQILITSISRFNSALITKINSIINIRPHLIDFQAKEDKLFNEIKDYVISIKDQRATFLSHIDIIEKILPKRLFLEVVELITSGFAAQYENETNNITITECSKLVSFFQEYSKKIDEDVYYVKLLFGYQEANILNEKLLQIVFLKKITNDLLNNESFLSKLLEEKDYSTLKIIVNLVRRKTSIAKEFSKIFFDFYYDIFMKKRTFPQEKSIQDGITYLKELIASIDKIIFIFKDIFLSDRIYQSKYNENILKMTNCKEIKNIHFLIAVYINKHINSKRNADPIYNQAFLIILKNLNEKEILFHYLEKFLMKRITTFTIDYHKEVAFQTYIRGNFEMKYLIKLERMIKDIKENSSLIQNDNLNVYLFSHDGVNVNDLSTMISIQNDDLLLIGETYRINYPHRQVTVSQTLSTALITFNKKYDITVNYIQAHILMMFNCPSKEISYDAMKIKLSIDNKHLSFFRNCIYALLECNILKSTGKSNELLTEDILTPNFSYDNTSPLICFEKVNQPFKRSSSITEDNTSLSNNAENIELILQKNKIPIIDCQIMSTLKSINPELLAEGELVRRVIIQETIKKVLNEQEGGLFIKKRIENLIEKGMIQMKVIDYKIHYSYFISE